MQKTTLSVSTCLPTITRVLPGHTSHDPCLLSTLISLPPLERRREGKGGREGGREEEKKREKRRYEEREEEEKREERGETEREGEKR
jgi:hypothetical protein